MNFKQLHQQDSPLLICNVWDVSSAKTAKKLGFKALATSSSAVAAMLGYRDGEEMDFSELAYIVGRIAANTDLPLSVDMEGGYSRKPEQVAQHIKTLVDLGVVGINFEDSVRESDRTILPAEAFAQKIREVKMLMEKNQSDLYLNVRTDPFLLGLTNPLEETKKRIALYEEAGADGIFVPCVVEETDIQALTTCTKLPINVMCMPKLPDFDALKKLGVKRISMGSFLQGRLHASYEQILQKVLDHASFDSVFN